MDKRTEKINELIETAKTAIKEDDFEKAVGADSALAQYQKSSHSAIQNQAQMHANQYDVISKYRINTLVRELIYAGIAVYAFHLTSQVPDWVAIGLYGISGLAAWRFIKSMLFSAGAFKLLDSEEKSIIQEKFFIQKTFENLSRIDEYQIETFDKMSEMYKRYEEKQKEMYQNQGLGSLFGGLGQHTPEDESTEDSEEETHS